MTDKYEGARANAQGWYASIVEMIEALEAANSRQFDDREHDRAQDVITDSVLSVEVRDSEWYPFGSDRNDRRPNQYRILLTAGGPGLQLTGTLSEHGEPETAELQMQDWWGPWQKWAPTPLDMTYTQNLLTFARQFYFGE